MLHDREVFDVQVARPIREHRARLVRHDVFLNRVRMAGFVEGCTAILLVFDADDDAACELGPALARLAREAGVPAPCRVVLAVKEIESWLIAGIESLRGYRGVPADICIPERPEGIRGAREWLDQRMTRGYKQTIDLDPMLQNLDYRAARESAPSLDKFLRDLDSLVREMQTT